MNIKQCKEGFFAYNPNHSIQAKSLALLGEYSKGETDLFKAVLKPNNCVVDIGAGIGCHTILMAKLVNPGIVYAFEPERHSFYNLCCNTVINNLNNIVCDQAVLCNHYGSMLIPENINDGSFRNSKRQHNKESYIVKAFPLQSKDIKPHFIKIDANGDEYPILLGCEELIQKYKPYLYINLCENQLILDSLVAKYGYKSYIHKFDLGLDNLTCSMMFCVPQGAFDPFSNSKCTLAPGGKGTTTLSRSTREKNNDFEYLKGHGIDIGGGYDPLVVPDGTVDVWDVNQGDAKLMKGAKTDYDFVYSAHCLEHLDDVPLALENWCRILKPGGYLFFTVPDFKLYEKSEWPSKFNYDHKASFSINLKTSRNNHYHIKDDILPLLKKFGVTVIDVRLEDFRYDYSKGKEVDQTGSPYDALAQILVIARKKSSK